ncbi:Translation protein beta-barrel domain superfamily [Arabidopsis suecica]|uniref:Translation protein beta-barrel domain superfamily n=1 Tax=Arabidopsis suecica TaxID=45249 RepID=A0A8T2B8D9_ARASU|nr:Translation protein beta-barrel domain superfamily [Arabidopsis suecica]
MDFTPTKLDYHVDMFNLQSQSRFLSVFKAQDGRIALILESTVFYPQGGGQPSDTGLIVFSGSDFKFSVQDVRSKDGIVLHYGVFEGSNPEIGMDIEKGKEVYLNVDESRRKLNSRLHSAGHLLDLCMQKVGLGHLEPGKGYHFPDGPFVEYKGSVPQGEMAVKQKELEAEANELITKGGKVYVAILPYEEASVLCGGNLPDYISKGSTPRIIKLGDSPGCPCGGTHVSDLSDIIAMKVTQMRTKKGITKVFYTIAS